MRLPRFLAALVLAGSVAACALLPGIPSDPIVTLDLTGGRCPDGVCHSTWRVLADGTIIRPDGSRGALPQADLPAIRAAIETTDWRVVLARPFTGVCPVDVDGAEERWTFATSRGPVVVASCSVAIDEESEPFRTLGADFFGVGG